MDCKACGHLARDHRPSGCDVIADSTHGTYPGGGCGCTALAMNATCTLCGQPFVCPKPDAHDPHECWACWQRGIRSEADERFAPLTYALRERGIPVDGPVNTGGWVMCLQVDLPAVTSEQGVTHRPYVYFSDGAEWVGAGVYLDDSGRGLSLDPSWYGDIEAVDGWATPGLADRTADWFANLYPALCAWATSTRYTSTHERTSWGEYDTIEAHYADEDIPAFPDATNTVW